MARKKPAEVREARADYKARKQTFKSIERALNENDRKLKTSAFDSERMGRIRQKGTKPELIVREIVSSLGHRYSTKNKNLPGSPDLANRTKGWAIFVHGCYWHSHQGCPKATVPKNNREFWEAKFARNRARDRKAQRELRAMGFKVAVVWECQTKQPGRVRSRLSRLLPAR